MKVGFKVTIQPKSNSFARIQKSASIASKGD